MALISVAVLSKDGYMTMLQEGNAINAFASGLASFSVKLGLPAEVGTTFFALTISAFMLTTLDTATRLARFTWQELFLPAYGQQEHSRHPQWRHFFAHALPATLIAVAGSCVLAFSGSVWQIWPVFGASNQMLAAMTLLAVTLMLVRRKLNFWIALIPMIFMSIITIWALAALLKRNMGPDGHILLVAATAILLLLALGVGGMAVWSLRKVKRA
jgi:carbon starvation protein